MKDNELQLVVEEKSLGTITTNAQKIKEMVLEQLPKYSVENYTDVEEAKKDRALLNKTSKALNDERIKLEKEFMQPFNNFKEIVSDTCNLIKEASGKLDEIVKVKENEEKESKKREITIYFHDNVDILHDKIKLDDIFNEKWLNKTYAMDLIENEITEKLKEITMSLEAISSLNSKFEIEITTHYLNTLDLASAIAKNNELLENDKILSTPKEENQEEKTEEQPKVETAESKLSYTLTLTATREKLEALKEYLKENDIEWKKEN